LPDPSFVGEKSAGTVRIFVLGESAAQGVPEPSFSFGRILEVLLRERYPGVKFEVINAAMTAINSHVCREIARDCAARDPDLFIVYMGNNEVVGPYGPGTIFHQWSPSLSFIRANIWLKATKTGQLLEDAMRYIRPRSGDPTAWRGLEMFLDNPVTADDPRLASVYDNYRQNLKDICRIARRARASVILSTIVVNLRDCPPFASKRRCDLTAEDLAKWTSLYREGNAFEEKRQPLEAMERYESAARIDDGFAELQFRMGRCLAALGRFKEARERFISARDQDALRFRADSQINATIRAVFGEEQTNGIRLVDAEEIAANNDLARDGIPGDGMFYEHVHLTFDGNYLLARSLLDRVSEAVPQLAALPATGSVPSRDRCAQLMALTPWDEHEMMASIMAMTSRPPFANQLDHATRHASRQRQLNDLKRAAFAPQVLRDECAAYQTALERASDEWQLHYRLGRLAVAAGQFPLAAKHLEIVRKLLPWEASVWEASGEAAYGCGRFDEAIADFRRALELNPTVALTHVNLGTVLNNRGRPDEAIAECRKALEYDPRCATAHFNLGLAMRDRGRIDEAIGHLKEASKIDPQLAAAYNALGNILEKQGRIDQAMENLHKALEVDPNFMSAHNNLGSCLRSRGRAQEAIVEFEKALEIDPKSVAPHYNLAITLVDQGRVDEAIAHYQATLAIDPRFFLAYNDLGIVLCRQGRFNEAIPLFQKAMEIKPDYAAARDNLAKARASRVGAQIIAAP
jgi:tetratricopeptide (TPR) repeat protein